MIKYYDRADLHHPSSSPQPELLGIALWTWPGTIMTPPTSNIIRDLDLDLNHLNHLILWQPMMQHLDNQLGIIISCIFLVESYFSVTTNDATNDASQFASVFQPAWVLRSSIAAARHLRLGWVKSRGYPCSSHQNSWGLWMYIPLKDCICIYWEMKIDVFLGNHILEIMVLIHSHNKHNEIPAPAGTSNRMLGSGAVTASKAPWFRNREKSWGSDLEMLNYIAHRIHVCYIWIYMVTWIPSIYPLDVSIYTSTMDPSWVDE